jgi:phosphate uptake regulator
MLQITLNFQTQAISIQTTQCGYAFQMVHKTDRYLKVDRYYFLAQHSPIENLTEDTVISVRHEPNVYT